MTTPCTVLIIDDEPLARELIRTLLKEYATVNILGECSNGFDALKAIQELKPDVIFLDIEMPKVNGLELLELLEEPPLVVFTTAYQEHAIKAFELNAMDYLLKPFTQERFKRSMEKLEERLLQKPEETDRLRSLMQSDPLRAEVMERVVVKTVHSIKVIPLSDLMYIEAQDDHVYLHTEEGKFLKQQTMRYFEERLPSNQFIRIHRSYLVNVHYLLRIEPYEKNAYQVVLKNQSTLPISRSGYSLLKARLDF